VEIISGNAAQLQNGWLARMADYRYNVFVEKLGWPLRCEPGAELDQFDRPDTRYVVAHNPTHDILGTARLLPTTEPYLLSEVFPQLMNGLPPPTSPDVWELSRFAATDATGNAGQKQFSSPVAVGLLKAALGYAAQHGAKQVITVTALGVESLLRMAGFHVHRTGPPTRVGGAMVVGCWIEV
jgi:acyl homoserine lactone synthase